MPQVPAVSFHLIQDVFGEEDDVVVSHFSINHWQIWHTDMVSVSFSRVEEKIVSEKKGVAVQNGKTYSW